MYFVKSEYVVHVLSRDTGRGAGRVIYFAYKSMCNATFTEQRCSTNDSVGMFFTSHVSTDANVPLMYSQRQNGVYHV